MRKEAIKIGSKTKVNSQFSFIQNNILSGLQALEMQQVGKVEMGKYLIFFLNKNISSFYLKYYFSFH